MNLESRSYEGELIQLKEGATARIATLSEKLSTPVHTDRPLRTKIADGFEMLVRRLHVPFYQDRRTRTQLALARAQENLRILQEIRSLSITDKSRGNWDASLELEDENKFSLSCRQVYEHAGRSNWWRPEYHVRANRANSKFAFEEDLLNTYVWVVEAALKVK